MTAAGPELDRTAAPTQPGSEHPEPGSGQAGMVGLIGRVGHRVARRVEGALGPDGPGLEQWRVLDLLADGAGHPMSEVAAYAMVPAPTLTKIIDRLVDLGLVYRRPDDADRRRVLVLLAERGREHHERAAAAVAAVEREILDELGPDGAAVLQALARLR